MIIYEVAVNGKVRCRAGVSETGSLFANLHYFPTQNQILADLINQGKVKPIVPMLEIHGTEDKEFFDWLEHRCEVGTEITIRILEAEAPSVPQERQLDPNEEAAELAAKKACYLVLKAEFENEGSTEHSTEV